MTDFKISTFTHKLNQLDNSMKPKNKQVMSHCLRERTLLLTKLHFHESGGGLLPKSGMGSFAPFIGIVNLY